MRYTRSIVLVAAALAPACQGRGTRGPAHARDGAAAGDSGSLVRVSRGASARAPALSADTITVRIGRPGTHAAIPLETLVDPARLRLVVDSPYQSWSDEGTFVHVVAFTPDGRPCPEADVYSGDEHVGRTDAHGAFAFRRTPNREQDAHTPRHSGALTVLCRRGDRAYLGTANVRAFSRASSFERPVMYVYTDRGVYNPGQTLHARAIAWRLRGEYEPVPGQSVALSLRREDGASLGGGAIR
ncbi:MAG: hypothetical protein WCJ30_27910 [Deltaproteobacteria bacterium]